MSIGNLVRIFKTRRLTDAENIDFMQLSESKNAVTLRNFSMLTKTATLFNKSCHFRQHRTILATFVQFLRI